MRRRSAAPSVVPARFDRAVVDPLAIRARWRVGADPRCLECLAGGLRETGLFGSEGVADRPRDDELRDPAAQAWALEEDQAEPIVRRAVEVGVTFFDTADMYSDGASEVVTGRLLTRLFARREDYVLATKVFYPTGPGPNDRGLSRKHLLASVDASLKRLGTEYVDLYQIHRFDPETPVAETVQALDDIVRSGKARYVGGSAMYAWQFAKLQMAAVAGGWTRFVSMQNRYNLVNREDEREPIPLCRVSASA